MQKAPAPPATEKQRAYAQKLGIPFEDDVDRRTISELIDAALAKQDDERYRRLDELQDRESEARAKLREEIIAELDGDDPRLSLATPAQIVESLGCRDVGAVLITFNPDDIVDSDDLTGLTIKVASSDNIDTATVKAVVQWLFVAMTRQ